MKRDLIRITIERHIKPLGKENTFVYCSIKTVLEMLSLLIKEVEQDKKKTK